MVKFLDIRRITESFQPELGQVVTRVIDSGWFVRGEEVQRFEKAYADFIGTAHCVGVGNGFDALRLIFRAWILQGSLKEGDEVIVPANTYIASLLAVSENRLTPVLVEPEIGTFTIDPWRIEEKVTPRTSAIMVVHLYGRNGMHPEIKRIAGKYQLKIVEDNAQAAGCYFGKQRTGSLGDAAAHSFFPSKNLGALGDGGAITTNDERLARAARALGNYGSDKKGVNDFQGVNSRLDDLQAAILNLKLARLDEDNRRRREAAAFYRSALKHPDIILPEETASTANNTGHVWHLFVIRSTQRDALQVYLKEQGVETLIHYPIPPHHQRAYESINPLSFPVTEQIHREVLSLPISPVIEAHELGSVVDAVNAFRLPQRLEVTTRN